MAPKSPSYATFIIYLAAGIPPHPHAFPRAPLSIDVIAPHFFQLLHFLASFVSPFPHFKKWKNVSSRNEAMSG
jgi:hypothetical protein